MKRFTAVRSIVASLIVGCLTALPAATAFAQAPPPAPQQPAAPPPSPQPPVTQPNQPTQPAAPPAAPNAPTDAAVPPAFPGQAIFNSTPPFLTNVSVDHSDLIYREGDTLTVQVKAEREANLYVFYHQCDGQSLLMFPNEARPANSVPAGQVVMIPGKGDHFRIRIQAPLGNDVLQVIASTEPLAELDALVQKAGRAPAVSTELINQLSQRLLADKSKWTEHRIPVQTVAKAADAAARQPGRFGLFIGVNQLQDAGYLRPRADFGRSAEVLAQAFAQRGQLAPNGSKLLLAEQATRAGMEEAITTWLAAATRPGDSVFICFSGYGGFAPAASKAGEPQKDEVFLVPYDNRFASPPQTKEETIARLRETMIFPETMCRWLLALPERKIVLTLDLCSLDMPGTAPPTSTASKAVDVPARLKAVAPINLTVITGWSRPTPLYFTAGAPGSTWLAFFLDEAMSKSPAPVTLRQAFQHYQEGWRQQVGSHPERPEEPAMVASSEDGPAVDLVPSSAVAAPQ